jgi:FAD/FMN-containing dehydrogenase
MEAHNLAVTKISQDIKQFHAQQKPFRIYHGSTNSTRKSPYQRSQMVDTSKLNHVLSVDTKNLTALCEPNVPMDGLVVATLPYGLVAPVVMEFPGITVGGGFAGTAGESSSFKYGFFDRIVNWIEIVTPDGSIIRASKDENQDLFFGAASSFGTLGVTTLLEVQLIPAKKYVALTHIPVSGIEEAVEQIQKSTRDGKVDYVDGIMFAKGRGVVCVGKLTDTPQAGVKTETFMARSDPWFYIHVDRLLQSRSNKAHVTEAIPLTDYLFRCEKYSLHSHTQC